jgi:hypothetical protein
VSKLIKTTAAGGVGFLAGLLLEQGLESLTGLDFVDGLFAVSGSVLAALSVNRELVKAAKSFCISTTIITRRIRTPPNLSPCTYSIIRCEPSLSCTSRKIDTAWQLAYDLPTAEEMRCNYD